MARSSAPYICGDVEKFGMPIRYVQEGEPLNTVGALLLPGKSMLDETFLSLQIYS